MKRDFSTLALLAVPLVTAMVVTLLLTDLGPTLDKSDYGGVFACVVVAVLADAAAMDFRIGSKSQPQSSLAFLPFLGSIALFAPIVATISVAFVVGISQVAIRRNRPARAVYNVCQTMVSVGLAGIVYHTLPGSLSVDVNYEGFFVAAGVFFTANIVSASAGFSFLNHRPFLSTLQQVTGPNGSHLWFDLLASPIALILIILYNKFENFPVAGVLIIVLPLILINYSYLSTQKIMKANQDLLRGLVKAIETRDPYTSGHSVRVSTLARLIATDLGLSFWRVHKVENAALLHDIGKIDPVFASVLRKPFDLSSEERALIQTHAAKGAAMLQDLRSIEPDIVASVLHHHERYDGTGYPSGLVGTTIPLPARIIMICDSVDAMLSDRPYRKALSLESVRHELIRCSGTQFDPEIVRIVLERGTLDKAVELLGTIPSHGTGAALLAV